MIIPSDLFSESPEYSFDFVAYEQAQLIYCNDPQESRASGSYYLCIFERVLDKTRYTRTIFKERRHPEEKSGVFSPCFIAKYHSNSYLVLKREALEKAYKAWQYSKILYPKSISKLIELSTSELLRLSPPIYKDYRSFTVPKAVREKPS